MYIDSPEKGNEPFQGSEPGSPRWASIDGEGDRLLISTGQLDDGRHCLYFRTDFRGNGVPLEDFEALMARMEKIRDHLIDQEIAQATKERP